MTEIRNILLIGRTGQGKSTLANVLINKNNDFEEVFKEGAYSISETKDVQAEVFEHDGIKYQIVDTIGLDDTELKLRQVIRIIAKGCKKIENGLSQVLFVIGEKFTREEVEAYKILRKVLFDEEVTQYTTIVRTKFDNFDEEGECKTDIDLIIKENNESIIEMIKSCNCKIIHIDNPPVNIKGKRAAERISSNKEIREDSRKVLLSHLKNCQDIYRPRNLERINEKIDSFAVEEIEILQKELKSKKVELEKLKKEGNLERLQSIEDEIGEIVKKIKEREELIEKKMNVFVELWNKINSCKTM